MINRLESKRNFGTPCLNKFCSSYGNRESDFKCIFHTENKKFIEKYNGCCGRFGRDKRGYALGALFNPAVFFPNELLDPEEQYLRLIELEKNYKTVDASSSIIIVTLMRRGYSKLYNAVTYNTDIFVNLFRIHNRKYGIYSDRYLIIDLKNDAEVDLLYKHCFNDFTSWEFSEKQWENKERENLWYNAFAATLSPLVI